MTDIASIASVITSIKNASDIARLIRESSTSLSEAENKLKLAELVGALADAKMGIAELRDSIEEKEKEIEHIKDLLLIKDELTFSSPFYFRKGDTAPFCARCWEKDKVCIHVGPEMWFNGWYGKQCPDCDSKYKTRDPNYT